MPRQLEPVSLSADLLYAVKTGGDIEELREHLATLDRSQLDRALFGREQRLAFWLNTYNAHVQLLLERDRQVLRAGRLGRWKFRVRDRIPIAGVRLSLSDIEHGMLRSSSHPWGLGYLPRPLQSGFERTFQLDRVDPRIHFALSRGDHGPPMTVYSPQDIDQELDLAVEWFLEENVFYDSVENTAAVPRRFLWYRGDFGGQQGIIDFLRRYGAIPPTATPSLEYDEPDCSIEFIQG